MKLVVFYVASALACALGCACGRPISTGANDVPPLPTEDAVPPSGTAVTATKVDLLIVVDDSSGMADKQALFASGLSALLDPIMRASSDVHAGVIAGSLGGRGSSSCAGAGQDRAAHLLPGFATFGAGATTDRARFVAQVAGDVTAIGDRGCEYSSPLEAMYRFLVQPDPYAGIATEGDGVAHAWGIDETLLAQRHDFLRADSLLAIVLLTDKNDASYDFATLAGEAWMFAERQFPDSPNGRAWRGTSVCATSPEDAACTSCAFGRLCDRHDAACMAIRNDSACQGNAAALTPSLDPLSLRFFDMKRRFGMDVRYPMRRYTNGLSSAFVPSHAREHDPAPGYASVDVSYDPDYAGAYSGHNDCANPIFSVALPVTTGDERCKLAPGPRSPDLVMLGVIAGVPDDLVAGDAPDLTRATGVDPEQYDFTGVDPRMLESNAARPGIAGAASAVDAVGYDWDTKGAALERACAFALPAPEDCAASGASSGCDCGRGIDPRLCDPAAPLSKRYATATPSTRALLLARAMNERSVAASTCPRMTAGDPSAPSFGLRPALAKIAARFVTRLQ